MKSKDKMDQFMVLLPKKTKRKNYRSSITVDLNLTNDRKRVRMRYHRPANYRIKAERRFSNMRERSRYRKAKAEGRSKNFAVPLRARLNEKAPLAFWILWFSGFRHLFSLFSLCFSYLSMFSLTEIRFDRVFIWQIMIL